jgi:ribosomal protein S18 acetylase RimI-like enzyme
MYCIVNGKNFQGGFGLITYALLNEEIRKRVAENFNPVVVRHLSPEEEGGFTFVAMVGMRPVGVISSFTKNLPSPLTSTLEAYIDVIEVLPDYKRLGVGKALVELTEVEAKKREPISSAPGVPRIRLRLSPCGKGLVMGSARRSPTPGGRR